MANYIIAPVNIQFIDFLWDRIEPILQRAVEKGNNEITCDTVKQRALNGDCLLCTVLKDNKIIAIATTEVRTFDTGHRALYMPIMAGNELEAWGHQFFDYCVLIAKEFGITDLRATGRKGWLRKLNRANLDFKEITTVISCEIGG